MSEFLGRSYKCSLPPLQEVVMLLLKFNADVSVINAEGSTPKNLARNPEIKTVLEGRSSC